MEGNWRRDTQIFWCSFSKTIYVRLLTVLLTGALGLGGNVHQLRTPRLPGKIKGTPAEGHGLAGEREGGVTFSDVNLKRWGNTGSGVSVKPLTLSLVLPPHCHHVMILKLKMQISNIIIRSSLPFLGEILP